MDDLATFKINKISDLLSDLEKDIQLIKDYDYVNSSLCDKNNEISDISKDISNNMEDVNSIKGGMCNNYSPIICSNKENKICNLIDELQVQNFEKEIGIKIKQKSEFVCKIKEFNKGNYLMKNEQILDFVLSNKLILHKFGDHLCKLKNIDALIIFLRTFNFYSLDLLEALRMFLSTFQLSGESQSIDRVI